MLGRAKASFSFGVKHRFLPASARPPVDEVVDPDKGPSQIRGANNMSIDLPSSDSSIDVEEPKIADLSDSDYKESGDDSKRSHNSKQEDTNESPSIEPSPS